MEIEIVTTKKKLSKSMLNQMDTVPMSAMQQPGSVYVLGYVLNVVKNQNKTYLVSWNDDYYIIADNWQISSLKVYRKLPKHFVQEIRFDDEYKLNRWWKSYQIIKDKGDRHIYI